MYMSIRWKHDHEYFQRMIEWEQRVAGEIVVALITNLQEFLDDESSSDNSSMPGLQSRGQSTSSSNNGLMPNLQDRATEDSFSDNRTMLCDEDGVDDDGKHCVYKARSLKQIIGTNAIGIEDEGGRFSHISMALFKYTILGPAKFSPKFSPHPKQNFCCTREYAMP